MGKIKIIISVIILVSLSVTTAIFLRMFMETIPDSRSQGNELDEINRLAKIKTNSIPKNKVLRYTIYTHFDTIYEDNTIVKHIDDISEEYYTEEELDKMRRLRNKEFVYDKEFEKKGYAITDNYIITKNIKDGRIITKAYFRKDPTNNKFTHFWYNGRKLVSTTTLHTFDSLTGYGISTNTKLEPVMVKEEMREKY